MSTERYVSLVSRVRRNVHELSASALDEARRAAPEGERRLLVVDIRESAELDDGTVPGATHVPRGVLERTIGDLAPDLDQPICVVCDGGHRSILAAERLQQMGYRRIHSLADGMRGWLAAGLGIEASMGGEGRKRRSTARGASLSGGACAASGATGPDRRPSWDEIRAQFPIARRRVPVMGRGERALLYLDHGASTHAPALVIDRFADFMSGEYANIHRGTHLLSRNATDLFDDCYYVVSDFIGGDLERDAVAFLTNTTQAIDLASHVMASRPGKVITTELEHHSNDLPHRKRGPVLRARVREDGSLDLDHLRDLLRSNEVKLVAVTGASNVTGWMPDIHAIAELAHEHGALILVDGAQLLAHQPIDVRSPDDPGHIDFLAAAGHKAYAPFGASFLYGPRAVMDAAPPYLPGGGTASRVSATGAEFVGSPDRHQGGTPNIGGVIAMAEAIRFLDRVGMERIREHELEITRRAMTCMRALDGVTLYGPEDPDARLGVLSFNVAGVSDLLAAAVLSEERGIACRNGRFCAHVYMDRLLALQGGHTPEPGQTPGAVRASFGIYNTLEDVDRLVEAVDMVRRHGWVGRYRVKAATVSAEFAGRCNDLWMESEAPAEEVKTDGAETLLFEQLNPAGPSRCYLVADPRTKDAMLVDPRRDQVDHYLEVIERHGLTLRLTLETHTHIDHLSGSKRLIDLTGCSMAMHHRAAAYCVNRPLEEGTQIELGELRIDVWSTPGHTGDSVCLLVGDRVLTGDTLLLDGVGRTDLGGDSRALHASLQRLRDLPSHTTVWPSHVYDGRTHATVGELLENNEPFTIEDPDAFAEHMAALGAPAPRGFDENLRRNEQCL